MNLLADWTDANPTMLRTWPGFDTLFAKLRPAMKPGVYVNFMSGDEKDRVPEATANAGSAWSR